jgi:HK97 family phage major capsid protein
MSYQAQLRQQLGALSTQIRTIVDTAKNENRGINADEELKFNAMSADYEKLERSIAMAEKSDKMSASAVTTLDASTMEEFQAGVRNEKGDKEHAKAFTGYLRGGMENLSPEYRALMATKVKRFENAQTSTTGSSGGFLVPQDFSKKLEEAMKFYGGILGNVASFQTETGNPFPWPTSNDTSNVGRVIGQNVQVTTTDLTFSNVTFGSFIFSSDSVLVPLALIQDSYFDIDSFVARKLGERIGRALNNKLTVGVGTTEPKGIVPSAVSAGLIYTAPNGSTTSIAFDDLTELEHTVDPAYRDGAKYMFNDAVLKSLKKLKDSANRPIWQPAQMAGQYQGAPATINDHPYVINNDMATMAAGAASVLFGDMSAYKVRRVAGENVTVLRLVERYADFLQVGYIGFLRADGGLVDAGTHPIAVLKNSAT